jgi:two-component system phosphate regulon sensor histidine kinase PhoR
MRSGGQLADHILSVQLVEYGDAQRLLLSRDITKIERLETMRRDFVANVSHELKTPLTVLAGFLETIREVKLPARQQEHYVALMSEQAERMQSLVADLLTLSALEADRGPTGDAIDMSVLLARIEAAAAELSKARHTITFTADPNLNLFGSETEIASALTNLVTNAIRYTPDGGEICVSWSRIETAQGVYAQFAVSDTGIGIEAHHLPRLTERFYRVDRGRSRGSGGTGLGLAIVKHVLTRHQGRLEVTSSVGAGSRFVALFPESRIQTRVPDTHGDGERRDAA